MLVSISICVLHGVAANFLKILCELFGVREVLHNEGIYGSRKMRTDDCCTVRECLDGDTLLAKEV